MTHIQFDLQVPVKHVGTLALTGKRDNPDEGVWETTVYFVCLCHRDAPLSRYFQSWCVDYDSEIMNSITEEIDTPDGKSRLIFFTRKVYEPIASYRRFLCSTASVLLRTLQHAEDCELSLEELDDEIAWGEEHMHCKCMMPNFKRPRHV